MLWNLSALCVIDDLSDGAALPGLTLQGGNICRCKSSKITALGKVCCRSADSESQTGSRHLRLLRQSASVLMILTTEGRHAFIQPAIYQLLSWIGLLDKGQSKTGAEFRATSKGHASPSSLPGYASGPQSPPERWPADMCVFGITYSKSSLT